MKKLNQLAVAALVAAGLVSGATGARAQDATISSASPDLIVGFEVVNQSSSANGDQTNVELDLGYTGPALVAAAIADGGSIVLGGTNFQNLLSANDLGATYGAGWGTRTSGATRLVYSVFAGNDSTDEFYVTSTAKFLEGTAGIQAGFVDQTDYLYSDLNSSTSTGNSNNDFITSSIGDPTSYTQAITVNGAGSNWGYSNFTNPTETVANTTIGLWDAVPTSSNTTYATEVGTFKLSPTTGGLTFTVVPEPSTWAMVGIGAVALLAIGRRRLA